MWKVLDKNYCFYAVEYDGVTTIHGFSSDVSPDVFFTNVARTIAFDDCTNENVTGIYWHGERVFYNGWKPGMVYIFCFCNLDRKVVWEGSFPEWDH